MLSPASALMAAQVAGDGEAVCREVIEGVVRDACVVAINRVLDNLARPYAVQSLCNELLDCITATFVARDSGAIRPSGWTHREERDAPKRIAIDPDARSTMESVYRAQTPTVSPTGPPPAATGRTRGRSYSAGKPPNVGGGGAPRPKGLDDGSESNSPRSGTGLVSSSSRVVLSRTDRSAASFTSGSASGVAKKQPAGKKGGDGGGEGAEGELPLPPYAKYLSSPDTADQEEIDFAMARYAEDRRKESITDKHAQLSRQLLTLPAGLWGGAVGTSPPSAPTSPQQQPIRGGMADSSRPGDSSSFLSIPGGASSPVPLARTPNSPSKSGGWATANTYKSSGADIIIDGAGGGRVIKVTKIGSLREGGGGGGRSPELEGGKGGRGGTSSTVAYAIADKPKKKKKAGPSLGIGLRRGSVDTDEGSLPETANSDANLTNGQRGRLSPLNAASARRVKSGPRHQESTKAGREQAFFIPDPVDNPKRMQVSLASVKGVNATGDAAATRHRGLNQQNISSGLVSPQGSLTPRKSGPATLQATYPPSQGPMSAPSRALSGTMPTVSDAHSLPQGWGGGTARAAVMEARRMAK
jgi:hypothetical protein